jgi:hypothetical protein
MSTSVFKLAAPKSGREAETTSVSVPGAAWSSRLVSACGVTSREIESRQGNFDKNDSSARDVLDVCLQGTAGDASRHVSRQRKAQLAAGGRGLRRPRLRHALRVRQPRFRPRSRVNDAREDDAADGGHPARLRTLQPLQTRNFLGGLSGFFVARIFLLGPML